MKRTEISLEELKQMDAEELLVLLVEAHTGGEYEKGLRAKIVYRAQDALQNFLKDLKRILEQ